MSFIKRLIITLLVTFFIGMLLDIILNSLSSTNRDKKRLDQLQRFKREYHKGVYDAKKKSDLINLRARTLIALTLLAANLWQVSFDASFESNYSRLINFNEAIILGYTFIAFIIAGTPRAFVDLLKKYILKLCLFANVRNYDIEAIEEEITYLRAKLEKRNS